MKKFVASAMAAAMAVSLAACGSTSTSTATSTAESKTDSTAASSEAAAEETAGNLSGTLEVWSSGEELGRFVEGFNKEYPDVTVNITVVPNADFLTKLTPTLASGQGAPDIFTGESDYVKYLVNSGYWDDLNQEPYNVGQYKDDIWEYVLNVGTDDSGAVRALSWQASPGSILYRRDLAKEVLGTDDPDEVSQQLNSNAAMLDAAAKFSEKGVKMFASWQDIMNMQFSNREQPWVVDGKLIIDDSMLEFMDMAKTITEKGYALYRPDGSLMPVVQADINEGPAHARHAMSMVAALLFERFQAGAAPLAVVSMDNCSHNGEKLQSSVMTVAKAWAEKGYVGQDFIAYLEDESKIAFPWSMIDKITPRPHKIVEEQLVKDNIEDMEPIVTSKNTFIAAFVNAERPQYLVVEDKFPNGRPPLEKAGVYMTDRDTVNKTERMKVTTCLNPLHTAMSVYGCMLGYTLICDEMKDADIVALIKRLGYVEGLPVVVNPGILEPKAFIDEVVEQRLPNPFMPDAPQRIATDTSQKVGIRFGETIKSYVAEGRDLNTLVSIPLAIAGWLRYLLAVDDNGNAFEVSADPLKDDLQAKLATIKFGAPDSCTDQLDSILSNASIFGSDLTKTVLADKVKAYFKAEIAGPGAVRKTLHDAVNA